MIPGQDCPHTVPGGEMDHSTLLLPEHVSVFSEVPVEIIGPPTPSSADEDGDFIEYLDYDDRNKVRFAVLES
jgi:hypothetical protein